MFTSRRNGLPLIEWVVDGIQSVPGVCTAIHGGRYDVVFVGRNPVDTPEDAGFEERERVWLWPQSWLIDDLSSLAGSQLTVSERRQSGKDHRGGKANDGPEMILSSTVMHLLECILVGKEFQWQ